jgi:hypothetical protein
LKEELFFKIFHLLDKTQALQRFRETIRRKAYAESGEFHRIEAA